MVDSSQQSDLIAGIQSDTLSLKVPERFRDSYWADNFPEVQQAMRDCMLEDGRKFSGVSVNFSRCSWADPIPLLSILLALIQFKKRWGTVRVHLPDFASIIGSDQEQGIARTRFTKFLAEEGFLEQLLIHKIDVLDQHGDLVNEEKILLFRELATSLVYQNAQCIPMTTLSFPGHLEGDEATNFVSERIDEILSRNKVSVRVNKNIPASARESLVHRLLQILRETLLNVHEHAYTSKDQFRYAGIYVRFRSGDRDIPQEQMVQWRNILREEKKYCPKLDTEYLMGKRQVIEIFVVDCGDGLVESLRKSSKELAEKILASSRPFALLSKEIFGKGISKKAKASRQTAHGGLMILHNLMEDHNDYIRGFDDATWIGASVPRIREHPDQSVEKRALKGLHWHFRISWHAKGDVGPAWESFAAMVKSPILEELSKDVSATLKTAEWWVYDERIAGSLYCRGQFPNLETEEKASENPEYILWLVRGNRDRKNIASLLDQTLLKSAPIDNFKGGRTLIIADIPPHEATIYMEAFKNSTYSGADWIPKLTRIILVSGHWAFAVLERNVIEDSDQRNSDDENANTEEKIQLQGFLGVNPERDHGKQLDKNQTDINQDVKNLDQSSQHKPIRVSFISIESYFTNNEPKSVAVLGRPINIFSPRNNVAHIVRAIRSHDSLRFWKALGQHPDDYCYLPNQVIWKKERDGKEIKLNGFLDFSQATTDPVCREILRRSLARLPGIFPAPLDQVEGLDSLTTSMVAQIRPNEDEQPTVHSDDTREDRKIFLGSVYVTGSTQRAAAQTKQRCIHFFRHPDSKLFEEKSADQAIPQDAIQKAFFLLWPRDADWFKGLFPKPINLPNLRRIGATSAVAPNGWKFFEIPRYDKDRKSIAARTPSESYQDWQDPALGIMKVGHWGYESHHDLITLNMGLAIDEAFKTHSDLACFIVFNTLVALGVSEKDFNEEGRVVLDKINNPQHGWIARTKTKCNESLVDPISASLLIYQSHPNTDKTIELLMTLISEKARQQLVSRIVPIRPLRHHASGSPLLVPPLVVERIRRQLGNKTEKTAVFFDDAVISGRTLRDTQNILEPLGIDQLAIVVLVSRMRLPGDDSKLFKRFRYYWRLDVPTLGTQSSCLLCGGIRNASSFKHALASEFARRRVDEWQHEWAAVSPGRDPKMGLEPTVLKHHVMKKFALRDGVEQGERIRLVRSVGLTSWISELHSMTCSDDYALAIAKNGLRINEKEYFPIGAASLVELLVSQLLLFEDEYSPEIQRAMLVELYGAIQELKQVGPPGKHSAIGALCFFALTPSHPGGDWTERIEKLARSERDIGKKRTSAGTVILEPNTDLEILQAFLIHTKAVKNEDGIFDAGERLLSAGASSLFERYNKFHRELIDYSGNLHSCPLPRLSQWLPPVSRKRLMTASDSADKLIDLVASFEADLPHHGSSKWVEAKAKLIETAACLKRCIDQVIGAAGDQEVFSRETAVVSAVDEVVTSAKAIHQFFFFDIQMNHIEERALEELGLRPLIEDTVHQWEKGVDCHDEKNGDFLRFAFSREPVLSLSGKPASLWVLWDSRIVTILTDLATNGLVRKSVSNAEGKSTNRWSSPCQDPWNPQSTRMARLWVKVDYRDQAIHILLANSSSDSAEIIGEELRKKAKARWAHLYEVGGKILPPKVIPNHESVVVIEIQLPYAGRLKRIPSNWWGEEQ